MPVPPFVGSLPIDGLKPNVRLDYFGPITITVGRHTSLLWFILVLLNSHPSQEKLKSQPATLTIPYDRMSFYYLIAR